MFYSLIILFYSLIYSLIILFYRLIYRLMLTVYLLMAAVYLLIYSLIALFYCVTVMFYRVTDGFYRIICLASKVCCRKCAHFIFHDGIVVTVLVAFLLDAFHAAAVVFYQVDVVESLGDELVSWT